MEILESAVAVQGEKRKEASSGGYGAGTSKRRRHLIADEESSAVEDVSATGADKDCFQTSPFM